MEKAKFSFAWVIAIIALMAFSYISFMGLVYWQVLNVGLCVLLTLVLDALIIGCVVLMCRAKNSRWLRLGILGQVFFGIIVLALLLGASVMFAHFTKIVKQQDSVKTAYAAAIDDAHNMDGEYEKYVIARCDDYIHSLESLSSTDPDYKALFSNSLSLGLSKNEIISKCVSNLKNLLKGSNDNGDLMKKREQWLGDISASVWNLSLPSNIRDITLSVNKWIDNYKALSTKVYTGETNVAPYENTSFNKNVSSLQSICKTVGWPSLLAVILAIVCYVLIMLPWIITPRNIASVGGDFDDVVEMPEDDD